MARFIVRVQLHETELTHPNYRKLHLLMRQAGFLQLTLLPGGICKLPHAEYAKRTAQGIDAVLAGAVAVASRIQRDPEVLVTDAASVRGAGLKKVSLKRSAAKKKVIPSGILRTAIYGLPKPAPSKKTG